MEFEPLNVVNIKNRVGPITTPANFAVAVVNDHIVRKKNCPGTMFLCSVQLS